MNYQDGIIRDSRIKIYPKDESILRAENKEVTEFNVILRKEINIMKECMDKYIGIAAPQVGINKKIIIMNFEKYYTMINPILVDYNWNENQITYPERCLSVPDTVKEIPRYSLIKVQYQTYQGEQKENSFVDLKAIAIQHELDHLSGKLIVDYKEQ